MRLLSLKFAFKIVVVRIMFKIIIVGIMLSYIFNGLTIKADILVILWKSISLSLLYPFNN